MHKEVIVINRVPTVIETWGRWIEETPKSKNEDIVLCIPGNPGVTGYYRKILEIIHKKLQCTVWIIGHAGHQVINNTNVKVPKLDGNENLYNIQGQIENKEAFIKKYVPNGARLFLIGHSVGAYICLNLLKNSEIKSKVVKSYLLFPTIEDVVETRNGQFVTKIIYYIYWTTFFISWVFINLPDYIQTFLIYCYFKLTNVRNENIPFTKELIHPAVLRKIFYMGFDEMDVIRSLDPNLIEPNMDKIKLYYGATDNWAPPSYYKKLVERYPDINAELCSRNFDHAFVLRSSEGVGNMLVDWIELDK